MDTQGLLQTVRSCAACGGSASKNARIGAFRARKPTIRVCTCILVICAHWSTPWAKLIDTDFFAGISTSSRNGRHCPCGITVIEYARPIRAHFIYALLTGVLQFVELINSQASQTLVLDAETGSGKTTQAMRTHSSLSFDHRICAHLAAETTLRRSRSSCAMRATRRETKWSGALRSAPAPRPAPSPHTRACSVRR